MIREPVQPMRMIGRRSAGAARRQTLRERPCTDTASWRRSDDDRQSRDDEVGAEHPVPPVECARSKAATRARSPNGISVSARLAARRRSARAAVASPGERPSGAPSAARPSPAPSSTIFTGSSVSKRHRGDQRRHHFGGQSAGIRGERDEPPAVDRPAPASTEPDRFGIECGAPRPGCAPTASRPCRRLPPAPPPATRSVRRRAPRHEVHGRSGHPDAVGERLPLGVESGNDGSSDGWMLRMRLGKASSSGAPTRRMKPARHTSDRRRATQRPTIARS